MRNTFYARCKTKDVLKRNEKVYKNAKMKKMNRRYRIKFAYTGNERNISTTDRFWIRNDYTPSRETYF